MTVARKPILHGRDHGPGGADPIPGLDTATHVLALWQGSLPGSAGAGAVWRVPEVNATGLVFALSFAYLRLETAGAGTTTVQLQKQTGIGPWTTITTLSVAAGAREDTDTTGLGSVSSGDLLRINWTALGSSGSPYTIQLEGSEG